MRVANYLGQTPTVGLQYSAAAQRRQKGADGVEPGRLFLTVFSGASYASEPEDMTSVGGFICCVGGGPTAWESKKQVDQALSSVESEYMALFRADSLTHVCAPAVDKLSARTRSCIFLGFPLDAPGWTFYDPAHYRFFASHDVTFDETGADDSGGARCAGAEAPSMEDKAASHQRPTPASPPGLPLQLAAAETGGVPEGGAGGAKGIAVGGSDSRGTSFGGVEAGKADCGASAQAAVRYLTREQHHRQLEREKQERFKRVEEEHLQSQQEQEEAKQQLQQQDLLQPQKEEAEQQPKQQVQLQPQQTPEEAEQQRLRELPDAALACFVRGPLNSPYVPPDVGTCIDRSTVCARLPASGTTLSSSADPSLLVRRTSTPSFILVYVNDLAFTTPDWVVLNLVKAKLQKRHTCTDLGELRRYLGLHITRDRAALTITLT
ncbi:unnamed protein product [Closterium sp. NIES-54]